MNRQLCLFLFVAVIASLAMSFPSLLDAASTNEARVTRVKNHVQLGNSKNIARSASVNDIVREQTIVRTGNGSRGEVTFSDETVVRLAAHTAFDFNQGTRGLNLGEGAVLIQAPKEANGAKIRAGGIAAAVADTTVMIEYRPGFYKFLVLEGTARMASREATMMVGMTSRAIVSEPARTLLSRASQRTNTCRPSRP